ncbi:DUF2726 domain-containing protein [Prosthecobacter sp.]|uniref:DUF2726 domain-containing protein n=1 Tax=Prosthecobacter sp. TaxID=1965333 RepID=UPI002ABBAAA0|nr:DUF2726 domain-containing protein [Prosthecobacter sp.]MDZ4403179.1 DUF2726 domain-containing protein [Prosthecobacter sp.]
MQLSASASSFSPQPLLTPAESLFHACLENLSYQRCHIQCKPRLAELLHYESLSGFHKICQRHIDFLIYRKEDWQPMLAIEFEDENPDKLASKLRDRTLVNEVFHATGIPLLLVQAKEIYQMETLAHKLTAAWQERCVALAATPPPAPAGDTRSLTQPLESPAPKNRLKKAAVHSLLG